MNSMNIMNSGVNNIPVYFDYCASTPIEPKVLDIFFNTSEKYFANASSTHPMGLNLDQKVNEARESISSMLNINASEIIFTSGATESNNMAIFGLIRALKKRTNNKVLHIITSEIEHPSVENCCKQLIEEGVEVTYLPVDGTGSVSSSLLKENIKENTVLVSIMHVNNEIGAIQPIEGIGRILEAYPHIYFHVDGVQGFGKIPLSLDNVDLYTISGHKIGGPKGVGILVRKNDVPLLPIIFGGSQEFGVRPGTTNVAGVLAITEAIKLALTNQEKRFSILSDIYNTVYYAIDNIPQLHINSPAAGLGSPHILNFSCENTTSALFLAVLAKQGIIASSQSACSSLGNKESRVLMSITHNKAISSSSVRLSFSESTTSFEVDYLIKGLQKTVKLIEGKKIFMFLSEY